ncbi:MAG TPA: serine/threonine-protein kinase, partial [Pirellulales bacterium]|nr:serine/threonine-protein kinase [Pirellulales bacterium]
VMELVKGVPITKYCDEKHLPLGQRLELFMEVCLAVQHAHQKGIIHRDLKPTNVMVSIQDGRAAPKIIDFGVAKAMNQRLTEHTLATGFAQIIGTPLYMSPEQAELSPLGVDTRGDIYSLGVVLYELLTGTVPFEKERLQSAPFDELRRIIREEEPPRPSARISTLEAAALSTIAEHRHTDAKRLRQTVRGELDWIVMKCLEKDRSRRYETANGLARDIERYLQDEPVQACPPSAAYRLKKLIRRNKIAAAFVLLLVAAVAGLTVSNIQTSLSERRANAQNARAQEISNLLQRMLRSANPDEAKDAEYTVRQMLDDFSDSFDGELDDQPEVEAEIRATIGQAYWRLGAAEKAEPHLTRALELRRDRFGLDHEKVAEVLVDMAWCRNEQARLPEAVDAAREALRIYRACGTTGAPIFQASAVLQRALISSNRLKEAEASTDEALAKAYDSETEHPQIAIILHGKADLLVKLRRYPEAENAARQAVEMHRRLNGPGHPETAWGLRALADALAKQQKYSEAEDALREALNTFRQRYRGNHHSVNNALAGLKQVLEAKDDQAGLDALAKEEADAESRSDHAGYHRRLAERLLNSSSRGSASNDVARQLLRRAIEEYGQVAVDHPKDLDRRLKAVDGYVEVTKLCADDSQLVAELDLAHRKLKSELEALLDSFPDSDGCREQVGHKFRLWAFAVQNHGKYFSQVENAHTKAIELFEDLLDADPNKPYLWSCVGNSYTQLGDIQRRSGKKEDREATYGRAMRIYDEHAANIASNSTDNASEMVLDYFRLARLLQKDKSKINSDKVHRFFRAVIDEYSRVANDHTGDLNRRATALDGYAQAIWHCAVTPGFASEVNELNRRLEAELPQLLAAFRDSGDCLWRTANIYRRWAVGSSWDSVSLPTAERAIRESIKLHEKLSLAEPTRPGVWLYLADRNIVLGYMLWRSARPDEAEAAYRRAKEIFEQHEADIEADKSEGVPFAIVIDCIWLADYLGCTGHADEAAKFIANAAINARRTTKPFEMALAHYLIALVQARLGDDAGYRETCKALIDVPVDNADDFTKVRTILTWCYAPNAIGDLSLPVKRAEDLAAHNAIDQPHVVPYVLGAALYRAGMYEEAAVELEKSIAAYPSDPQPGDRINNLQRLFLAMTKWHRGQQDEARRLLAEIQTAIDEELRSTTTQMNYRITLEVLRREAEDLIDKEFADEAAEKRLNAEP